MRNYLCRMPLVTNYIDDLFSHADISFHAITKADLPVSVPEMLNLCGGIPSPLITNMKVDIHATYRCAFGVKIISDQYEAVRNMDFSIGRIDNNFLFVNDPGQGIGTNLFLNQFQSARQIGFKRIHLTAMALTEDEPHWTGYHFWACIGFQNADIKEFEEWTAAMGISKTTLEALVQSDEGRNLWKTNGFTWIGDFFLTEGHSCIAQLRHYLERKEIDFPIYS